MLFGAMGFSYANFGHTRTVFDRKGTHSANLGDNMQSLAVRHLYRDLGIPEAQVVRIDRDHLPYYDGPPVVLPMNAVFPRAILPVSDRVIPVFIGFHASGETILKHRKWLARQGPIGCRDPATAQGLTDLGIAAHVTGCLTCCLPERRADQRGSKVILVQGSGNGAFPEAALAAMPKAMRAELVTVKQRRDMTRLPLTEADMAENDSLTAGLLDRYRSEARLIVTALHHAAAPCMAAGIPVVLARKEWSERFGFLQNLLPVHLGPDFSGIDWYPAPVDMAAVKAAQIAQFKAALSPWL